MSGGRVITYTIDGEGRRVSRFVDGVFNTGYMHDTSGRLVAEVEPSGHLRSHFVYATESHSPDYMIKGGVRYYFVKDQLGSMRAVINADTGNVAQAIHYDEFGRVLADSNPGFQPFGFAGGHFDHETGLVRFGARDYDAEIGRWTAKDPILFGGKDRNLYRYVIGDPINRIDPGGKLCAILRSISHTIGFFVLINRVDTYTKSCSISDRPTDSEINLLQRWSNDPVNIISDAIESCYDLVPNSPEMQVY